MKLCARTPAVSAAAVKCDLAAEVLRSFGSGHFSASGRSMVPAIWPEDTIVVETAGAKQIQIGDVVVFARHGILCAHRVTGIEGDATDRRWITQGDALPEHDLPVFESELLGRVAYVIRAGRLIPVDAELSFVEGVTASILRRSVPVARALVFMYRLIHATERPAAKETVRCPS